MVLKTSLPPQTKTKVGRLKKNLDVPSRRKTHPDILYAEYEWINNLSYKSHKLS